MTILNRLKQYLLQDVGDDTESGRAMYLLRVAILGEIVYFALFALILFLFGKWTESILPISCFGFAAFILQYTYRRHPKGALVLFYLLSSVWVITAIVFFGWNCGLQHMLFVLLVLVFTTSYQSMAIKIPLGFLVYGLRMGLYFYTKFVDPLFPFPSHLNDIIQLLDTTMVYLLLILIMSVFASDTLRAESKLAKANRKLNALADTDPLTKLPNRRFVLKHIEECIYESPHPICPTVAIGDIDFFKKINDTYGHEAGDRVLEVISDMFRRAMETYGVCARWGGEEFLFFFEDLNIDNAYVVLFEILDKLHKTVIPFGDEEIRITMTFGMEDAVLNGKTMEEIAKQVDNVIQKADEKLYIGKNNGRNQIVA